MSKNVVTRFTWTDDSGGGLDGTIINNAQLQAILDAVDGAIGQVVQVKAVAYTALVTDDLIKCTGTWTLDLFTAVGNDAKALEIKNSGTGVITMDAFGAQTIDGATTRTLSGGASIRIRSDGANWIVVSGSTPSILSDAIVVGRTRFGGNW